MSAAKVAIIFYTAKYFKEKVNPSPHFASLVNSPLSGLSCVTMPDISGQFEVDGLVKQRKELEQMLSSNPDMEKRLQKVIRKVLMQARRDVMDSIQFKDGDPRQARKAVKTAVYRRILGGSVSLLNKRKAGAAGSYEPPRKGSTGRGGNRRRRSRDTQRMMGYKGSDRAFVLRFLNQGTAGRNIENFATNPKREEWPSVKKWSEHPNTGNRGSIAPRNFFSTSSHTAMQKAAEQLSILIDDMIKKELK